MVAIGIIGNGPTADVHRERYERIDDVELVESQSDSSQGREVIDAADAIDICSPPSTHRPVIENALSSNKDVLCTPPLGGDMDDATAIAAAAEDSDGTVLAGHVSRFSPGHVNLRDSIQEGSVGESGVIRLTRTAPTKRPDEWHDWYAYDGNTGDILFDCALHDLDYLQWAIGSIERVFTRFRGAGAVEHAVTLARFANGATAHVETIRGSLSELEYSVEMDIAGTEGILQYDTSEAAAFEQITSGTEASYAEPPLTDGDGRDGYYYLLDHFVSCVADDERPNVTVDEGVNAQRLATAARRSSEIGRPVTVEEVAR